jgi:hypothetical protein
MFVDTAMAERREREKLDRPPECDVKGWALWLTWMTMLKVDEVVVTRKLMDVDP